MALAALSLSIVSSGAALAASGGTYGSPGQDCPWYGASWNAPDGQTYPGCHNVQISVESGGTTNGNPNDGWNDSSRPGDHGAHNTTWVQYGSDQVPNDPNSQGTPTPLSAGYPGQSGSPHAGCLAVNTDGTGGGAAPDGTHSTSPAAAENNQKYGCGNNPKGTGFSLYYDYYQYYCPVAAALSAAGYPACEKVRGGDTGQTTFTPDTGSQQNLTDIASQGVILYYGMDDNTDNGEHDGEGPGTSPKTAGSLAGASDAGGIMLAVTPQSATRSPSLTNPEGLVNLSMGFCADGNCINATTQRQSVYQGCGANTGNPAGSDRCTDKSKKSRDAYNYDGKQWDPYNCSSGGSSGQKPEPDSPAACDTSKSNPSPSGSQNPKGGMDYWRQQEAQNVYAEPGVQFYGDPDPEASPEPFWPEPAFYAGTCGIAAGGGQAPAAPASPFTNRSGQILISTGC